MRPVYDHAGVRIFHGDNRDVLATLEAGSFDACVTDPPYELGFMGKAWDKAGVAFNPETWRAVLRVLKPGAHLLAFGGTRTYHRMACAIEDAGFEIRDCLVWMYGSGFPKSLDVSKAIDKAAGAEREVVGVKPGHHDFAHRATRGHLQSDSDLGGVHRFSMNADAAARYHQATAPATDAARQWEGWGTALKPAYEPIIVARKPLQGTVVANVLKHGTGALNIDGCRIPGKVQAAAGRTGFGAARADGYEHGTGREYTDAGRWPANVILDEEAARMLDEQSGECRSAGDYPSASTSRSGVTSFQGMQGALYADTGGASRFFYVAKASAEDRERGNDHPTVKPLTLMRYLVKLVAREGATVLDPFMGSGPTLRAAKDLSCAAVGIELEARYCAIAEKRLRQDVLFPPEVFG